MCQNAQTKATPRNPTLTIATLVPVAEHTFRLDTPDGFSAHGALMVFELDTAGKVQQVKVGAISFYPQTEW